MSETARDIQRSAQGSPTNVDEWKPLTDEQKAEKMRELMALGEDGGHPMDALWHIGAPLKETRPQEKEVKHDES